MNGSCKLEEEAKRRGRNGREGRGVEERERLQRPEEGRKEIETWEGKKEMKQKDGETVMKKYEKKKNEEM